MTNRADGSPPGNRSAAGPISSQGQGKSQTESRREGVSVTEKKASGHQSRSGTENDDASRQDRSASKGPNDATNQQPGRKKRRWRSRRKRGSDPNAAIAQQGKRQEQAARAPVQGDRSDTPARSGEDTRAPVADKTGVENRSGRRKPRPNQNTRSGQHAGPEKNDRDARDGNAGRQDSKSRSGNQSGRERGYPARSGKRGHAPQKSSRPAYAALDLGTNNCRLLVAEPHGQSFRVVDAFSRIVRLGEGLSQTGRLSDEAQERAIAALKVCQSKLNHRQVKRFRLIATEACRRAANGGAFLHKVYTETGLKLEIVNRETEARLAVAGCASLVHPEAEGVVLFDIGGGSSEIVWLDLDPVNDENVPQPGEKRNRQTRRALRHLSERIRCWTSLQVGVVTLSEKHGGRIVRREQFEDMVAEVRDMLHEFDERESLAEAIQSKHIHMLGTSGTVTTLAGVHLGLERYDRRQVDGTWLSDVELRSMIARILDMDFDERVKNPCIGQDRADLVLAGCAILEAFHREWPVSRLRVADRGLREGILTEMMIDDGVWTPQSGKKKSGKNRRPRRRGARGHRGQQGQPASSQAGKPTKPDQT